LIRVRAFRVGVSIMAEKEFLVQRFAKIPLGQIHVIGYSVAGEETLVQVPELNVCFDIGRAPYFALTSDIVCLTHGHMDHVAGLPYYLSQRSFQGMKPGTILLPRELERPVDNLLRCWRDVERQATPYSLVGMSAGDVHEVRRDFAIRCFGTHHGGPSLGYSLISVREKLKQEYVGKTGPELVELKKRGIEIQYRLEVPLVAYLGDTTMGEVFDHPDVQNAEVLITEVTFFDADHKAKAKAGRHLHLDHFFDALPRLKNRDIVLIHVSRRTGVRRARNLLRRRIGDQRMKNIHFLMDFDGAIDAGDIDSVLPAPPDNDD
jgi:ribonuclease Z